MNLLPLCAFALLAGILLKISEELFPKFKPLILAATGILFFLYFIIKIAPLWTKLFTFGSESDYPALFALLFKGFGIALVVSVSASFCRDLGEEKVAEKLELCGKGAILYLSLPILEYLLKWIGEIVV
ncbi:MAG: hypothetical protein E7580_06990 [Ruminococcaceae bacterium]|nr:hypothetical protein [Oscillospiraceae bacterium]